MSGDITDAARLWLFDIDGTLIAPSEDQVNAWRAAFREAFGLEVSPATILPRLGLTFAEVVRAVAGAHGESVPEGHIQQALATYLRHVREALARRPATLLAGVRELLDFLKGRGEMVGVVTGNFLEEGEPKLTGVSLRGLLDLVVYADLATPARDSLLRQALTAAHARGFPGDFPDTVVVGDSVHDIQGARRTGALAVAVCTGVTPRQLLMAAGPDLLVPDLLDLLTRLRQMGGRCIPRALSG